MQSPHLRLNVTVSAGGPRLADPFPSRELASTLYTFGPAAYNLVMPEKEQGRGRSALIVGLIPALLALLQVYSFTYSFPPGLPIDDAYIFKRYAENLAAGQGFSFNPGETSFGCTSVIWPLLMAGLLDLSGCRYEPLAVALGGVMWALAAAGVGLIILRGTRKLILALAAGVLTAASPHLLMNAVSGMETPLSLALLVAFSALVLAEKPRPLLAGFAAGLLTLNRPEAAYFPAGAVMAWLALRAGKGERLPPATLLKFLLPWAALALPAGWVIHRYTGLYLPATYLGKIVSSVPEALHRGLFERLSRALLSLADGWVNLAWPLHFLAPVLAVGAGVELVVTLRRLRGAGFSPWPQMGRLILFGYFFLPGVYGFSFPVHPPFGGYYLRYIAPVHAVFVLLGIWGLFSLGTGLNSWWQRFPRVDSGEGLGAMPGMRKWMAAGRAAMARHEKLTGPVLLVVVMSYQGWLWSFQFQDARAVFAREVALNTGLRMQAAAWIRDPAHVPPDAKVMVGTTGLGVVGGNCQRYVLDLGALINPDIFPYYLTAPKDPHGRWLRVIQYMRDRGVTYYVTFALTPEVKDRPDPAATPGFIEAARLGALEEPKGPYDQVRIYRLDWGKGEEGPRP